MQVPLLPAEELVLRERGGRGSRYTYEDNRCAHWYFPPGRTGSVAQPREQHQQRGEDPGAAGELLSRQERRRPARADEQGGRRERGPSRRDCEGSRRTKREDG